MVSLGDFLKVTPAFKPELFFSPVFLPNTGHATEVLPTRFTCMSFMVLLPCSSLLLWLWSQSSDLVALSLAGDTASAASETFIASVSAISDILIAKSYAEMLANTENLKDRK